VFGDLKPGAFPGVPANDDQLDGPQYSTQIIAGAKASFLSGADWAYPAGIIAIVVGAAIVFFLFPKREQELQLLATYHAEDTTRSTAARGQIKPVAGAD
jgi:MFS transporter, DHA2 family, multidrug resistance protein